MDRAALDAALALGLPCGGWCPRGRRAEDGPLAARYPLRETPSARYAQRTAWNVRDSDGTLLLLLGALRGGTALTAEAARRQSKPLFTVRLDEHPDTHRVRGWIAGEKIAVLNVAGPRASEAPGIYEAARAFLERLSAPS